MSRPAVRGLPRAIAALGSLVICAGSLRWAGAAPPPPLAFQSDEAPLTTTVPQLSRALACAVELRLDRSDAAHRLRPTVRMSVSDPADLLNAVTSAYGVRWLWLQIEPPRRIALVTKRDYVGTAAGLRHSLTNALPPELHPALVGELGTRSRYTEGRLKLLKGEELDMLERMTEKGAIPISELPPTVTRPLLIYLATFDVFKLARDSDRFVGQAAGAASARCRYGKARDGAREFFFPRVGGVTFGEGPSRWDYISHGFGRRVAPLSGALEAEALPLRDAAAKLGALLRARVELRLERSDPAFRARPTLRISPSDPADLLDAVAAAYGLRWIWVQMQAPRRIVLVSKRDYVGSPVGLRQSLTDALPPEMHGPLVGSLESRVRSAQRPLERLTPDQLERIQQLTATGTLPIGQLPRDLSPPVLEHMIARSALALGGACDRFIEGAAAHSEFRFRYGTNPSGQKEFSFERANRSIGVVPD